MGLILPDKETYNSFFTLSFIQEAIADYKIAFIIYDAEEETIKKWIKQPYTEKTSRK